MGRKVKIVELTEEERAVLEKGFRQGDTSGYSLRCQIILLKSRGYSSEEIASIQGTTIQPVNAWVKRYHTEGIEGLSTKEGRGRKPILDIQTDASQVRNLVKSERQRLILIKEELESGLDKKFSLLTLKRFLKNLSADGNASD